MDQPILPKLSLDPFLSNKLQLVTLKCLFYLTLNNFSYFCLLLLQFFLLGVKCSTAYYRHLCFANILTPSDSTLQPFLNLYSPLLFLLLCLGVILHFTIIVALFVINHIEHSIVRPLDAVRELTRIPPYLVELLVVD